MTYYLDGNNICFWKDSNTFSLTTLLNLLLELKRLGHDYVCFFDANVLHLVKDNKEKNIVANLLNNKSKYRTSPGGQRADEYIVMAAHNTNFSIISNDWYRTLVGTYPWLGKNSTPQRLFKGSVFPEINGDYLMIPDLKINKLIESNIQILENELNKLSLNNKTMANNDFATESPENYEQKCCCALVLDVSGSMSGAPINELNEGLREFHKEIQTNSTTANRLEVAVIEFSDIVNILVAPSLAVNFSMPHLTSKGSTKLVDGVREAIKVVRSRKAWYKQTGQPYYRPWIILITDAVPDGEQDVNGLSFEIKEGMNKKDFFFFALGVQGADMNMLSSISHSSMAPAKLQGLKFSDFFKWLSASLGPSGVTGSKDGDKIDLPNPANWMTQPFTV